MMKSNQGLVAITSLLIISAVALSIAISMTMVGINSAQNSLTYKKGQENMKLAFSCLEEALIQLKKNPNFTGETLNQSNGSCTINVSSAGANKSIQITATLSDPINYVKKIQATARTTGNSINLLSWQEI